MKFIIIGLLLWCAIALPSFAGNAGETKHRIVTLNEGVGEEIKGNKDWRMCGNYFAETETGEKKIIHFAFEKGPSSNLSKVFTFTLMDRIVVSIKKVGVPMVMVLTNGQDAVFFLMMNVEDYKAGLPCLAKGMKV